MSFFIIRLQVVRVALEALLDQPVSASPPGEELLAFRNPVLKAQNGYSGAKFKEATQAELDQGQVTKSFVFLLYCKFKSLIGG